MAGDPRYSGRVAWLSRLGTWIIRLIGLTWRYEVVHDDAVRAMRAARQNIIFVLWHGQLLPLIYYHRKEHVAMLVSEHADGEIIARIAERLGYRCVRGSTSRGAARALLEMTRTLHEGYDLAITPDGPRGPAKSFAPGAAIIAQRSGAPVIAAAASARSAWRLKSWDQFLIPRPFARVRIAYTDATRVAEHGGLRDAAGEAPRLRDLLLVAEDRAGA